MTDFKHPGLKARYIFERELGPDELGALMYSVGPGGDFDSSEIRALDKRVPKDQRPIPVDVLEAILLVKREFPGSEVV